MDLFLFIPVLSWIFFTEFVLIDGFIIQYGDVRILGLGFKQVIEEKLNKFSFF